MVTWPSINHSCPRDTSPVSSRARKPDCSAKSIVYGGSMIAKRPERTAVEVRLVLYVRDAIRHARKSNRGLRRPVGWSQADMVCMS